jgi:hypothetical protein
MWSVPKIDVPAFHNGVLEQPLSQGRQNIASNTVRPARFSKNGYVVGIASELSDVLLDPLHAELLVKKAIIAVYVTVSSEGRIEEKAEHIKAVIYGDDDRSSLRSKRAPVVSIRATLLQPTSKDPKHHG